jgi:sugar lactone lactonase YvrE
MYSSVLLAACATILGSSAWAQPKTPPTLILTLANPNGGPKTRETQPDGTIAERMEFTQPVTGDLNGMYTERTTQTFAPGNEEGLAQITTFWKIETSAGTLEGFYFGIWDRSQNLPRISQESGFVLAASRAYSAYQQKEVGYRFLANTSGARATVTLLPHTTLNDDAVGDVAAAAEAGAFHAPLDATPDPDGGTIYFTAKNDSGLGVFSVSSSGGDVSTVLAGAPFVEPRSLASSPLGNVLYVADTRAGGEVTGAIFALSTTDNTIEGTIAAGYAPRSLDVTRENGGDVIYFTGRDPRDGTVGVFKTPAAITDGTSNTIFAVFKGAPLVDPDGVVVSRDGVIYVSDRSGGNGGHGAIFRFDGQTISKIVNAFTAGDPAGVGLTRDENRLLVSALDDKGAAQILLVDLTTFEVGSTNKGIGQNHAAGGLHRAQFCDTFAWANSTNDGAVYQVPIHTLK